MLLTENLTPTAAQIVSSVTNAEQCSIAVVAPMDDDAAKKISTDERIAGAGENDVMNYSGTNGITPETSTQDVLQNLPPELLLQKRFFPVRIADGRKVPCIKGWQLPENQMSAQDAIKETGLIGMDIAGHGRGADYFFVDFDNVLDDNGNFVFDDADRWDNYLSTAETYRELSISGEGLHFIFAPNPNKFPVLKGGNANHAIYFDDQKHSKIELFFKTPRYVLLTGSGATNADIVSGEVADEFCQQLVNQLACDLSQIKDDTADDALVTDTDIPLHEVRKMLAAIDCAQSTYGDWFKIGAILHYHFGEAAFELWRTWSESDKTPGRYTLENCKAQWRRIVDRAKLKISRPAKIGSLIRYAQQFGYKLPRRTAPDVYTDPEAAVKQAEAQKSRDQKIAEIKDLRAQPQSAERDEKIRALIRDLCEWKTDRKKRRTEIKATQSNLDAIFQNDPDLDGLVGYDEFAMNYTFLRKAPWGYQNRGDQWTDADDAQIRTFLRRHYANLENRQIVFDNVVSYGQEHAFHEVKEFFRSLPKWDGVKRAETLFVKFLGADDTPYTREVTINWLTAAVARIFHAGCDYQLAPILLGAQGIGKSHICRKLFGKWYGSLVDDVADTHAIDTIQRLWGVEVKEMAAMKKDVDANKRFIDAACDVRRFAYDRRAKIVPRHCVFLITTNNLLMLADTTGNRRYPVIHCHNKTFVEGLTDEFIQQLWSEVFAHYNELFKDGFDEQKLSLSTDAKKILEENNQQFMRDNSLKAEIVAALDQKILPTVIWNLMSKPERRQFFQNGGSIAIEETDLITRFKASRKRIPDELQAEFDEACRGEFIKRLDARDPRTGVFTTHFVFYGTEYRKHICAAEILNEAFEPTDKRKSPNKIHELLATIDGWTLGERIARDRHYGNQPKVYYRDPDNNPDNEDEPPTNQPTTSENESPEPNQSSPNTEPTNETSTSTPEPTFDDYLQGDPLTDNERDDCPFDLDQFD